MIKPTTQEFEGFIKELLERVPFLETRLLRFFLAKRFGIALSDPFINKMITAAQRDGYLVVSTAGYTLSKRMYYSLTGDQKDDSIETSNICYLGDTMDVYENNPYGVKETKPVQEFIARDTKELMECMWVVADLMPQSKNFVTSCYPWNVVMEVDTSDERVKICEITRITKRNEDARIQLIKDFCNSDTPRNKKAVMRIAVIDNEEHAFLVPYLGFVYIVVLDETSPNGYRVIEKREKEEAWKDAKR